MSDTIKQSVKSLFDKIGRNFMRVNAIEYPKPDGCFRMKRKDG